MDAPVPEFDPLRNEKTAYTLRGWAEVAKAEIDRYVATWEPETSNTFHQEAHTWAEWWNAFHTYMSW